MTKPQRRPKTHTQLITGTPGDEYNVDRATFRKILRGLVQEFKFLIGIGRQINSSPQGQATFKDNTGATRTWTKRNLNQYCTYHLQRILALAPYFDRARKKRQIKRNVGEDGRRPSTQGFSAPIKLSKEGLAIVRYLMDETGLHDAAHPTAIYTEGLTCKSAMTVLISIYGYYFPDRVGATMAEKTKDGKPKINRSYVSVGQNASSEVVSALELATRLINEKRSKQVDKNGMAKSPLGSFAQVFRFADFQSIVTAFSSPIGIVVGANGVKEMTSEYADLLAKVTAERQWLSANNSKVREARNQAEETETAAPAVAAPATAPVVAAPVAKAAVVAPVTAAVVAPTPVATAPQPVKLGVRTVKKAAVA